MCICGNWKFSCLMLHFWVWCLACHWSEVSGEGFRDTSWQNADPVFLEVLSSLPNCMPHPHYKDKSSVKTPSILQNCQSSTPILQLEHTNWADNPHSSCLFCFAVQSMGTFALFWGLFIVIIQYKRKKTECTCWAIIYQCNIIEGTSYSKMFQLGKDSKVLVDGEDKREWMAKELCFLEA